MSGPSTDSNGKATPTRRKILRTGALLGSLGLPGLAWGKPSSWAPAEGYRDKVQCFLKGARILTTVGEVKVEDLAVGDLTPTLFGGARPIQWIGRFSFKRSTSSKPWPKDVRPVRIARSALAPNVPRNDLYVTQAHALLVDGVLISAGLLVNGTTITLDEAKELDRLEYFHVKLETHDVIYAEGAPAETLLTVDESAENFVDYFRAHGEPTEESPCLPIISTYRQAPGMKGRIQMAVSYRDRQTQIRAIRDRLAERARKMAGVA